MRRNKTFDIITVIIKSTIIITIIITVTNIIAKLVQIELMRIKIVLNNIDIDNIINNNNNNKIIAITTEAKVARQQVILIWIESLSSIKVEQKTDIENLKLGNLKTTWLESKHHTCNSYDSRSSYILIVRAIL